jgi:hypothetical protein
MSRYYLHPLSIPSRTSTLADSSPYTSSQSSASASWSNPPSRSASTDSQFLSIPDLSPLHIKDADSVDKLANAAAGGAATPAATATASSASTLS